MARKDKPKDFDVQLSAYLDGELTAAQTEKMEQILAEHEEARELLQDLKDVRQSVQDLPRLKAPEEITEDVMQQFERDMLLDRNDGLSVVKGERYLRIRRFIAAAAMIVLTGTIGYLVYTTLMNPNRDFGQPDAPTAVNTLEKETPGDDTQPYAAARAEEPAAAVGPIEINVEPKYSKLHLEITTRALAGAVETIEQTLAGHEIRQVLRSYPEAEAYQYAFVCDRETFAAVFAEVQNEKNQLTVEVSGSEQAGGSIAIENPSRQQVMALAGEADASRRLLLAVQFHAAKSPGGDELSFDTMKMIADQEPPLNNLRTLSSPNAATFKANDPDDATDAAAAAPTADADVPPKIPPFKPAVEADLIAVVLNVRSSLPELENLEDEHQYESLLMLDTLNQED